MDIIELMKKEMFRRKYSLRTIKTYLYCINKFLIFSKKEIKKITKHDAIHYLNKLTEKNYSGSTINVYLQSIKFMLEEVMHRRKTFYNVKFSKTPKKLPEVLTQEEIIRFVNCIKNKKHKLIMKLMYSAGLRSSELVHLKVNDLEFENNHGWVRKGKGNKDRLFIIANTINKELQEYIKDNNLEQDSFLFKGYKYQHISQKSIYMIVKKTAKKAKIMKKISPHTFRHSYATHLIENGYDVYSIQSLLGHNSAQTTKIYVHMASPKMINVKSPLDSLNYNFERGMEK